jgi:ubiquinone/menaquinone biosynthesis C-methylase UbiE
MSSTGHGPSPTRAYALGHSDRELERLSAQARLIDPITRQFFRDAGIVPGMRVLDVGSGAGDVSFLVADMVGDAGEVVGVDRAPNALAAARARAAAQSRHNVLFLEGDPAEMEFERTFNAVVGRYVLQFQPDPVAMLRKLAVHLRPGGSIVFHEIDWDGARSFPPLPTMTCVVDGSLRRSDCSVPKRAWASSYATFLPPTARAVDETGSDRRESADRLNLVTDLVGTLLPEMERLGIATYRRR